MDSVFKPTFDIIVELIQEQIESVISKIGSRIKVPDVIHSFLRIVLVSSRRTWDARISVGIY
jgi:hypothetical protein